MIRRNRARSRCRTCGLGPIRFGLPTWLTVPTLSPATSGNSCSSSAFLDQAKPGGTFLLNSPFDDPQETWSRLPQPIQQAIIDKQLKVYAINAYKVCQ
jgi:hypothetical protein